MKLLSKSQKQNTLVKNVLRTLAYYWQIAPGYLVSYCLLIMLQVVSGIAAIYFASRVIGELANLIGTGISGNIYWWLVASGIALILERFAWKWLQFVERKSWTKWYVRIILDFNAAVSGLDLAQHQDETFTKMIAKLSTSYQYTPANFAYDILRFGHSVLRLLSSLFVILSFAPWLVVIMIISLIPSFLNEWELSKNQWSLWQDKGDKAHLAYRTTHYLLDKKKLHETKIFGTRGYLLSLLDKLYGGFYKKQRENYDKVQRSAFGALILEAGVIIGAQVWLINRAIQGNINLATFSFYSGIIAQFSGSLGLVAATVASINDSNHYMRDFYKLLDMKPILRQAQNPVVLKNQQIPTITFEHVSFRYPGSKKWALEDVSLKIEPGQKIALVGENGAGKSTLIKLLLRLYDCNEGKILVNGIDIREIDLNSYYSHIGVLFQDFNDYPFSVRDNIALGRVENLTNDARVRSAAKMSGADKFIQEYPLGYDQLLETGFAKGVEPSGGQWQRIALARALFRDAGILILDEPTAAVDAKSEYAIFKTLEEQSANKSTIIISHRFSTVRQAETIYVLENGGIKEQGPHKQLMKQPNGLYKEMFNKQAAGYK